MIVEFPFWYSAIVVVRGGRKTTRVTVVDTMPVRFPEFALSDASVAATVSCVSGGSTMDYLTVEGRFVRPMPRHGLDDPRMERVTGFEEAQSILLAWAEQDGPRQPPGFMSAAIRDVMPLTGRPVMRAGDLHACRWISDDREDKAETARNFLENRAAMIDGSPWLPSEGPCHSITINSDPWPGGGPWGTTHVGRVCKEMGLLRLGPDLAIPGSRPRSLGEQMRHLGMANKARWPVRFVLDEDVTISAISETLAARQEIVALSIATGQMADVVGERVHKLDDAALLRFADLRESLDTGQSDALVISLGEAVVSDLRTARIRTHPDRDCLAIHHRLAAWETRNASAKQPRLIGAEVPANDVLET